MMNDALAPLFARVRLVAMDIDGTLTDGVLYYDEAGVVTKGFYARDGLGMELLRRAGILRGFVTGRVDGATEARARCLGMDFLLTGIGNKAEALRKLSAEYDIPLSDMMFVGDDLNDYTAFEAAGVAVAVGNSGIEMKRAANYVTRAEGGRGAIREVVDLLLEAKGIDPVALWKTDTDTPVSRL
jgi:3-deoxy-D-manno-octulosonate 8-phosphate phosphatase (KDO 8-P phosphatase)